VANGALDADGLVNLSKLKTHPLTRLTGAVKNQFGCVPGLLKSQYHVTLPDPFDFAAMLVDLNTLVRPRFCVMDGVMAMEGNGPRSGVMRKLNVLLFSTDPIALDATACRIINVDPEVVTTSGLGEKAGLGTYHSEDIEARWRQSGVVPLPRFRCHPHPSRAPQPQQAQGLHQEPDV